MSSSCFNLKNHLRGLVCAALTLLSPFAATAGTPLFGVFLNAPGTAKNYSNGYANYENWLNSPANVIVAFGPNYDQNDPSNATDDWAYMDGSIAGQGLSWAVGLYAPPYASRVVWSLPMLPYYYPTAYGTLAAGAAGQYTGAGTYPNYWAITAQTLYNAGFGKPVSLGGYGPTTIRLGWEFNGNWFPWSEYGSSYGSGTPANYVAYWKNIVNAMRTAEPNAQFKFNWCGAWGGSNPDPAFPTPDAKQSSYVDQVGFDIYDNSTVANLYPVKPNTWSSPAYSGKEVANQTTNFSNQTTDNYGLNYWVKEAAGTIAGNNQTSALPLTVPEWGLNDGSDASNPGGLDNQVFIEGMYNFFTNPSNNVSWASYFNGSGTWSSQIFSYSTSTGAITTSASFPTAISTFASPSYFGSSTPTLIYPVYTETSSAWVNNVAWTGGYGTVTATSVDWENWIVPYSGLDEYDIKYTSAAGFELAFNEQNVSAANYVRLAIIGPLNNSTQTVVLKLTDQTGDYSTQVTLSTSTDNGYALQDIPLSKLTGVDLTKINSLYFYMTANSGTKDEYLISNVEFIHK